MPVRPDLVDCWIFRRTEAETDVLLLRRAPDRILPGLWQGVSGSVEPAERIVDAARREVLEETGIDARTTGTLFDLDLVNAFHWPAVDAIVLSAQFALRVGSDTEPVLSHEHDAARWVAIDAASREVIWPGYRDALARIRDDLSDPDRAVWFELDPDGAGRRIE
jgi:8-oxo-dGTP pyrophosphatase MutT (NUDIX family)